MMVDSFAYLPFTCFRFAMTKSSLQFHIKLGHWGKSGQEVKGRILKAGADAEGMKVL